MNADAIARGYRWIEYAAFGDALELRRISLLNHTRRAKRILLPGEGDGRFLQRLLGANAEAEVDVVESSGRMIDLAAGRIPEIHLHRVRFHQRDFLHGNPPRASYDLIVTNFFLDCFPTEELREVTAKCAGALTPDGLWLVNEFNQPTGTLRGVHARAWLRTMYGFFRLTTGLEASSLPPYPGVLRDAGLRLTQQEEARLGLVVSQIWAHDHSRLEAPRHRTAATLEANRSRS